jgi:hypothetical protein
MFAKMPKKRDYFFLFYHPIIRSWLIGEQITYPDFHLYEMLDQHRQLDPDCLKAFPNLEAYIERYFPHGRRNKEDTKP